MSASTPTTTPSRRWPIAFAAVRAGARQIQGTLNGLGERCGNAQPRFADPDAQAQAGICRQAFDIGVSDAAAQEAGAGLARLTSGSTRPDRHAPYVGDSAFATKAGIHASAIMKDPATYEHVAPDSVGNKRKVLVSEQAGKSNFWPSSNVSG